MKQDVFARLKHAQLGEPIWAPVIFAILVVLIRSHSFSRREPSAGARLLFRRVGRAVRPVGPLTAHVFILAGRLGLPPAGARPARRPA